MEEFDRDYFERGLATGKSLYENYRWIPELTIPLAMTYIDLLGLKRTDEILDFGCAKGYVVKALRMLHRQAWGCDISYYALESADPDTTQYLAHCDGRVIPFDRKFDQKFDWIIAKDVLEHINEDQLQYTLDELRNYCSKMFAIIPLGKNDKFFVSAYHLDKTHKIAKGPDWWADIFRQAKWRLVEFRFKVEGIKDNWADHPMGNGFFILR